MGLLWARWEDGHTVVTVDRLAEIEEDWTDVGGLRPEAELLRVFMVLSSTRPTGMGPGHIPVSEMLAARAITWLETSPARWVSWIRSLDNIYMDDQSKRQKIRASQAKAEAKRKK